MASGGFSAGCQSLPNSPTAACLSLYGGAELPGLAEVWACPGWSWPHKATAHLRSWPHCGDCGKGDGEAELLLKLPSQGNWEEKAAQTAFRRLQPHYTTPELASWLERLFRNLVCQEFKIITG